MKKEKLKTKSALNGEVQPEKKEEHFVKTVNSAIFESFKKLTSNDEKDRIIAGIQLLQNFSKNQNEEKKIREVQYALKRLIRGIGSSTSKSRAGFFTTLVGFLETIPNEYISVQSVVDIVQKELHVGAILANKEDADAVVGQILVCGALLRSNKIVNANSKDIEQIVQVLISSSKHRTYHHSLAYSFIVGLLQKVNEQQFAESIWPKITEELEKPVAQQTISTIHCIIEAHSKFPTIVSKKFLKMIFGHSQILNPESYKHLLKIFWENTYIEIVAQPAFECFGIFLTKTKNTQDFWITSVDPLISTPTKLKEIQTLKIITDIISNCDPSILSVSSLFTTNFIKMAMTSLKSINIKKDETLKAFYNEFFEAIISYCSKPNINEEEKFEILRKIILYPGIINIEKYTSTRVVHQILANFKEESVKSLFCIYKDIFLDKILKNPNDKSEKWLNMEKSNAGFMMQTLLGHKNIQLAHEWRFEQLKFFMTLGLFHVDHSLGIVKRKDDSEIINEEFADQMKNMFYTSLQTKITKLKEEKKMLVNLVNICNEIVEKTHCNKYFRNKIDEKTVQVWNAMYKEVTESHEKHKKHNKLDQVFHILILHMGLQLFKEPEMAENAILDLEKCMRKMKEKRDVKSNETLNEENDEPEWIEVVIDLFLHLLSQNSNVLRNIVNKVFPHLCNSLTLTSFHQILSTLEMKDGFNPLSEHGVDNDTDDTESSESEADDNEVEQSEEEDDSSDDEDEEEILEEEEEPTETEKLRSAISNALVSIGKDDDQDSIDLDDMNEEDGKKLDEALGEAFRAMRKNSTNAMKRSKSHRVETTTVMHFRIRVLDLIEIYLAHNPTLLISLEIILNLFNMIEYCNDKELEPLSKKIDKVLNKLTNLRQFSSIQDVSESDICNYLAMIIDKKFKSHTLEVHSKIRSKCCIFLIHMAKLIQQNEESNDHQSTDIVKLFIKYTNDFIKSRNPIVNLTLLSDIFRLRWSGIFHIATHLISTGLTDSTRTYRRIQITELLEILYNNHELIRQNLKVAKKSFKTIELSLETHMDNMINQNQISAREFMKVLDVLFAGNRCHNKVNFELKLNMEKICKNVQEIRKKIKLETMHSYNRFCTNFHVKPIKNIDLNTSDLKNGNIEESAINGDTISEDKQETKVKSKTKGNNDTVKRKNTENEVDNRKRKKIKKEQIMKIASEGLNGGFTFNSSSCSVDVDISDGSDNIGDESSSSSSS